MKILHKYKSKDLTIDMFEIPIYGSKICLMRYTNDKAYDLALKFLEKLDIPIEDYDAHEWRKAYGYTFKERTNKYGYVHFVFMNKCKEYKSYYENTLSHEIVHLVENISQHHGLTREDGEANEHIAYLTGYLFEALIKIK